MGSHTKSPFTSTTVTGGLTAFIVFLICIVPNVGHKQHFKKLRQQIEKQNVELTEKLESVKMELISEIDTIFNASVIDGDDDAFIQKSIAQILEREVRRLVGEAETLHGNSTRQQHQRLISLVEDVENKLNSHKRNMQSTYEQMLELWYDCRAREKDIERLLYEVKKCKCSLKASNAAGITPSPRIYPSTTSRNINTGAFGLVIADENSDHFKLVYLNSKRVRTLKSGRRNVTDVVYNPMNGRLYYSLPDSVWSSYLDGRDERLLRNCTTFCMELSFNVFLNVLQCLKYNATSRQYTMCEIPLYDDTSDPPCEEAPFVPYGIMKTHTSTLNMKDRVILVAAYDGGKVHWVSGYFNISELGLNETDNRLPRSGDSYEISYQTLTSVTSLFSSSNTKPRELITRVPTRPSSLTLDDTRQRVFISYGRRSVIDVFDIDTDRISTFTTIEKPWGVGRKMCLIN